MKAEARRRRPIVLALGAVVAVSLSVAVVVLARRESRPAATCGASDAPTMPVAGRDQAVDRWSRQQGPPVEGESVVEVADTPADAVWRFRSVLTVPTTSWVREGTYRPG